MKFVSWRSLIANQDRGMGKALRHRSGRACYSCARRLITTYSCRTRRQTSQLLSFIVYV